MIQLLRVDIERGKRTKSGRELSDNISYGFRNPSL